MRSSRRTPEEWESVLNRFKSIGLTQAAFCEKETIKIYMLRDWLYRPVKSEPQFVPLVVHGASQDTGEKSCSPIALRVEGVSIEIDVNDCVRILRAAAF